MGDVVMVEAGQFANPQASVGAEDQHGVIARPEGVAQVDGGQELGEALAT